MIKATTKDSEPSHSSLSGFILSLDELYMIFNSYTFIKETPDVEAEFYSC
jgi:hypothetical protein